MINVKKIKFRLNLKRKAQIKPYLVLDSNLGVGHAEFGRQVCVKVSSIEETDLSVL